MKKLLALIVILGAFTLQTGCQFLSFQSSEEQMQARAHQLAQKLLIIDTHQDVPYRLMNDAADVSRATDDGHFDYPRAQIGGLNWVFMAAYVPAKRDDESGSTAHADRAIDLIHDLTIKHPDKFTLLTSPDPSPDNLPNPIVYLSIGIENGSSLEGDLANLSYFYNRGVRYITLCHSKWNHICDSSYDDQRKWQGLSPFGRNLIHHMNRLGMIIDVSHVSDDAFYQILELSRAPVVATHSSCRHFTPDWERNMDDDMIKLLVARGGVIQINFGSTFISETVNRNVTQAWNDLRTYFDEHELTSRQRSEYAAQYYRDHPVGEATVSQVVDHIDHVVNLVGIDHVGLGSDFDGVRNLPVGLEDVSMYPNLIYELLQRGYTESEIEKICSGNFLRVWRDIETAAQRLN